ncbi:MAG: agmatine deiminase family protein [Bacteroidota bacterium]
MRSSFLLIAVFAVLMFNSAAAQWQELDALPRYETVQERLLRSTYVAPPAVSIMPPLNPVRAMAEYEEIDGIIVRWAYGTQNLLLSQITDAAQEEGKVWIMVRPGTSDSTNIKTYLAGRNIPLTNLDFVSVNTNSIWCRDYGPWTVYDVTNDSIGILDFRYNRPRPQDDLIPVALASRWNLPLYQTLQSPDSLVHTGGNFMVDGFDRGFSSELIINENPHQTSATIDSAMRRYSGLSSYIKMDPLPYDVIHHIDMHMKLLDEETLLIGEYPVNVADYAVIESTVDYLETLVGPYGRPYTIIRIPMPPDAQGRYPNNGSDYLTYTNSVIINKTVLVPIYSLPQDQLALDIYADAMPGYTILGFDCNSIIPQLGAIHCITKEIGVREPVHFAHKRILSVDDTTEIRFEARIKARSGIDSAVVFWTSDSATTFHRLDLTDSSGMFSATIAPQPFGSTVWYYIQAYAGSGREVTKPLVGAAGAYSFEVVDSTTTSVEDDPQPFVFGLEQNYPNPFNPATSIRFRLPHSAEVTLKVFDVLGREIAVVFEGSIEAGAHTAIWTPTGLASGVYYYRLSARMANGQTFTDGGKAILLK